MVHFQYLNTTIYGKKDQFETFERAALGIGLLNEKDA